MKRISIFASGSGTNAQAIYDFFKNEPNVVIDSVVVSNPKAGILDRCKDWGCEVVVLDKKEFKESTKLLTFLQSRGTDLIVLAGFLWLIPDYLTQNFPNKIVNIHPALLPKFGGKGMYGTHVHQAVAKAQEAKSGITIHYINEVYDEGEIIVQKSCEVKGLKAEDIAKEVLKLEHYYYPRTIAQLLELD